MFSVLRFLRGCHRKEGAVMFCEVRWGITGTPWVKKGERFELKQGVEHLALSGPRQVWMGIHRGMCS